MCKVAVASLSSRNGETSPTGMMESKCRPRVRFGVSVEHVFEKDFTDADLPHIWYTEDEFLAIKQNIYTMIRSTRGVEHSRDWHWRGFEHIKQGRPRKQIRRQHSSELVSFQHVICSDDPVGLGLLAISSSRDCSKRARELAIQDEYEAFAIYNDKQYDDSTVPDTESVTDSSFSDENCLVSQAHPQLTICRNESDDKMVHLLQQLQHPGAAENQSALSMIQIPFKMVLMLLPCIC